MKHGCQTKLKTPAHVRSKSNTNCQIRGEIMKMKHCGKTNKPGADTIISFEGHLKLTVMNGEGLSI